MCVPYGGGEQFQSEGNEVKTTRMFAGNCDPFEVAGASASRIRVAEMSPEREAGSGSGGT